MLFFDFFIYSFDNFVVLSLQYFLIFFNFLFSFIFLAEFYFFLFFLFFFFVGISLLMNTLLSVFLDEKKSQINQITNQSTSSIQLSNYYLTRSATYIIFLFRSIV